MAQQQNEFLETFGDLPLKKSSPEHLNYYEVQILASEDEPTVNSVQQSPPEQIIICEQNPEVLEQHQAKALDTESTVAQRSPAKHDQGGANHYRNIAAQVSRFDSVTCEDQSTIDYGSISNEELGKDILRMKEQMALMLETVNKVIDNNRRALLSPEKSDLNHLNLLVKEKINSDRWLARSRREVRKLQGFVGQMETKPEVYHLDDEISRVKEKGAQLEKQVSSLKRQIEENCRKEENNDLTSFYKSYRRLKYQLHQQRNKQKLLVQTEVQVNDKMLDLIRRKMESDKRYEGVATEAKEKHVPFGTSSHRQQERKSLINTRDKLKKMLELARGFLEQRIRRAQKELQETNKTLSKFNSEVARIAEENNSLEWQIDVCLEQQQALQAEAAMSTIEPQAEPESRQNKRLNCSIGMAVANMKGKKLEKLFAGTIGSVQFIAEANMTLSEEATKHFLPKVGTHSFQSIAAPDLDSPEPEDYKLKRPNVYMVMHPSKRATEILSRKHVSSKKELDARSFRSSISRSRIVSRQGDAQALPNSQLHFTRKQSQAVSSIDNGQSIQTNPHIRSTQHERLKRRRSRAIHTQESNFDSYVGQVIELQDPTDYLHDLQTINQPTLNDIPIRLDPINRVSSKSFHDT